jgi:hypothetical protein
MEEALDRLERQLFLATSQTTARADASTVRPASAACERRPADAHRADEQHRGGQPRHPTSRHAPPHGILHVSHPETTRGDKAPRERVQRTVVEAAALVR